jgi:hypothetical protein
MSGLAIAALALVSLWLGVLTLVVILTVRQIGLLSIRLAGADPNIPALPADYSMDNDGLEIGSPVPEAVTSLLPQLQQGRTGILLAAATCTTCHELVQGLRTQQLPIPFVALIPGPPELVEQLAALLPPQAHIVRGLTATEIANTFGISNVPFGLVVADGTIVNKRYLRRASDFVNLVDTQGSVDAARVTSSQQEVLRHVA